MIEKHKVCRRSNDEETVHAHDEVEDKEEAEGGGGGGGDDDGDDDEDDDDHTIFNTNCKNTNEK